MLISGIISIINSEDGGNSMEKYVEDMDMTDKDHMEFLDTLLNSKAKIMLSGYRHPLYDEKLKEWKRIELKNQSTSGSATTEIIWMNYRIGSYVQRTLF
jgi:DNA adenine methylase